MDNIKTLQVKAEYLAQQLEALVDATNLESVVAALAVVAEAKADHIAHAWQDVTLAKTWAAAAEMLDKAAFEARGI